MREEAEIRMKGNEQGDANEQFCIRTTEKV